MKSTISLIALILLFTSCSKKENGKCYTCKKTVAHSLKTLVGNEVNGYTNVTSFEKCFVEMQDLKSYEDGQFVFKIVGDSAFSESVECK